MTDLLVRYAHFLAILILTGVLFAEHLLLRDEMSAAEIRRLARIDRFYGLAAAGVLAAGLTLWMSGAKPAAFYTANPVFHAKLGLFALAALISIHPTVFLIRQSRLEAQVVRVPRSVRQAVRLELAILILLPLLAVLMAHGVGLRG
ncbi:DUF2214 family protein [Uliginosibacterium paludis]|uniref:DUF2214 family protein n=1 Tax=Uliginosibacterium paludis TaxID=1615952 RepID=A0ABV2CS38_9RHOO